MTLDVQKTNLDGVLLIKPPTVFEDFRGCYVETYNQEVYRAAGIGQKFVQDDISVSRKNVLRGIHGDGKTWKLISCLYGGFYLAVVNWDPSSPQYRKWQGFTLSDVNRFQVLIPPRFGNGHQVLTDTAIFHYKQTTYYDRPGQFTIRWDDPVLGITWPMANPLLSERDEKAAHVRD